MITPITISLQDISQSSSHNQLFGEEPVIICQCEDFINPTIFMQNLTKQLESSELQCLVVVDILSQQEKPKSIIELDIVKISQQIPIKKILDSSKVQKEGLQTYLHKLDIYQVIKKHQSIEPHIQDKQKVSQEENSQISIKKYGSFSLRLFPFHKSLIKAIHQIPTIILPLTEQDILSYQKVQKICNYEYILALPQYSQKTKAKLETTIYLNWGQNKVEFRLLPHNQKYVAKIILQPLQILIIPPNYSYKWNSSSISLTKLLTWNIIPKRNLPTLLACLQDQNLKEACPYSITQVLIDYCFHQFSLIEAKNEDFMYNIVNYIHQQFTKEFESLKQQLYVNEKDILWYGVHDNKIDECQICSKPIVNYFAIYKNNVYCVECAKEDNKISQIYHKISRKVFQEGCELLSRIHRFKQDKQIEKENVLLLRKTAVFFSFEDFCDGDFIGAYNSSHCKIHQGSSNKQKNSKQKIVQNTIKKIKENLGVLPAIQILDKYSRMKCKNQVEKQLYQEILVRASNFIKKEEEDKLLCQMLPDYNKDDLRIFAIQLWAKNKFEFGPSRMSH